MLCHGRGVGGGQKADSRAGLRRGTRKQESSGTPRATCTKESPSWSASLMPRAMLCGTAVSGVTGHEDGLCDGFASRERTCC